MTAVLEKKDVARVDRSDCKRVDYQAAEPLGLPLQPVAAPTPGGGSGSSISPMDDVQETRKDEGIWKWGI